MTLPESAESAVGALTTATRLRVHFVDAANAASNNDSGPVDLWVDTAPPTLTLTSPAGLCGSFSQASTTLTQAVTFTTNVTDVDVEVTNNATTDTYNTPSVVGGVATFSAVVFDQGQNDLRCTATDPAGNTTALVPDPCSVTVGSAPVLQFVAPEAGETACPFGSTFPDCLPDIDNTTAGWQGNLVSTSPAAPPRSQNSVVTFTPRRQPRRRRSARRSPTAAASPPSPASPWPRAPTPSSRPPTTSPAAAWAAATVNVHGRPDAAGGSDEPAGVVHGGSAPRRRDGLKFDAPADAGGAQ